MTITQRDKDLLSTILYIAVLMAGLFGLVRVLGELHGLYGFAVALLCQLGFLTQKVSALERKLRVIGKLGNPEQPKLAGKGPA